MQRKRFIVQGQVQGVGFRPFVFTLAEDAGLTGFVRNSPRGVVVEVQGPPDALRGFAHALEHRLPPLARITGLTEEPLAPLAGEEAFTIAASSAGSTHVVLISPDTATCADCLVDMADRTGRRYRYPFTNCTNCGPRYTITRSIPYDRAFTSMACFPLCPDCRAEYENPRDRRFHAQPNACPLCGPEVTFCRGTPGEDAAHVGDAAITALAGFLAGGGIAAVKGLGGFHLVCDACDNAAVDLLRRRKRRPHKPFALMAADLETARRFARVGEEEERLLLSPEHPIVICRLRDCDAESGAGTFGAISSPILPSISPLISPDTSTVGIMLPYTPLHAVLLERFAECLRGKADRPAVLVMTSGNPGGEPICLGNREALAHLGDMADAFLFHNRDILIRVDDSVVRPLPGRGTLYLRRARGYVPRPVAVGPVCDGASGENADPCVLGVGAELKNTLCLTKGADAFVSQHIGDMANLETAAFHAEIREHLAALLKVQPGLIVRDRHPDYLSSRMAEDFGKERGLPVRTLQHHYAHAHAVLAEHAFRGRALVLALDGTGLGEDGTLWGGEAIFVDSTPGREPEHRRLAHLAPLELPGGEAAIREPWRIAHAALVRLGLADPAAGLPWLPEHAATAALLPVMLERRINTPLSTSLGRLFDAVAALLGLCNATTYEGQAAIRLEEAQGGESVESDTDSDGPSAPVYPWPLETDAAGLPQLNSLSLIGALFAEKTRGVPVAVLARRFHHSLAWHLAALADRLAREHGVAHVGLSGGCLQNRTLALGLARELETRGLTPLLHRDLPPGDGCISLGQAAWGRLLGACP